MLFVCGVVDVLWNVLTLEKDLVDFFGKSVTWPTLSSSEQKGGAAAGSGGRTSLS